MSPISFATAAYYLDDRKLRDIGIDVDGTVIDPSDPRYRHIPQARMRLIGRLMMRIGGRGELEDALGACGSGRFRRRDQRDWRSIAALHRDDHSAVPCYLLRRHKHRAAPKNPLWGPERPLT